MYAKKETRFRDEIRRIVLLYALWPLLAAAVLVILIVGFVWVRSSLNAGKTALESMSSVLSNTAQTYDAYLLSAASAFDMDRFETEVSYQADFKAETYRFINSQTDKGAVYLVSEEGELLFSSERSNAERERLMNQIYWRLLRRLKSKPDECVMTLSHEAGLDTMLPSLLIGRRMEEGYLCFALPASVFEGYLAARPADVIVTDEFGTIFLGSISKFHAPLGKIDKEVEGYHGFVRRDTEFYYVCQGDVLGGILHVYAIKSVGELVYMVVLMSSLVAIMLSVMIVVILVSSRRMAQEKTKIIDEIVEAFQKAQQGELANRLEIHSDDEFGIISQAYNSMIDSIQELMERTVLQAQETAVSRVRQLEAQFNPHFLFNTLENVRFMVRLDPKAADTMILCLSRLLRYSIKSDKQDVELQEDLSYVYNYLSILKFRFGDRLSYRIHIPEELENYRLPRLIMQPILENAIIYGMQKQEKLHIDVQVGKQDDMLCVRISDDGPGIPEEKYQQILEKMNAEHIHVGEHMGILNVHYRLRLIYGTRSGLEIHTREGEGTDVSLILPLINQEGEGMHDA